MIREMEQKLNNQNCEGKLTYLPFLSLLPLRAPTLKIGRMKELRNKCNLQQRCTLQHKEITF